MTIEYDDVILLITWNRRNTDSRCDGHYRVSPAAMDSATIYRKTRFPVPVREAVSAYHI